MKKSKQNVKAKMEKRVIIIFLLIVVYLCLLYKAFFGIAIYEGTSMEPTITDRSVVVFMKHNQTYEEQDLAVVRDTTTGKAGIVYVKEIKDSTEEELLGKVVWRFNLEVGF